MAMVDMVSQNPEEMNPEAHFDLNKEWAKMVRDFKPGQVVKVLITGKVDSQTFSKPDDPEASGFDGHCCVEMQTFQMILSQKNQIAELFDDDEDD